MVIVSYEKKDLDEINPCELEDNELAVGAIAYAPLAAEAQKGWQAYQI